MARRISCLLLLVGFDLFTLQIGNPVFAHKWSNASGKYSVEAEFIALESGTVKLKKEDGRIVLVPLEKLSNESREQAKKLAAVLADNTARGSQAQKTNNDLHANEPDVVAVDKFLDLYRRLRKAPQLKLRDYTDAPNIEWRCFIHATSPTGLPVVFAHLPSSSKEEVELMIDTADEILPNRISTILRDRKVQGLEPYLEVSVRGEVIRVSQAFPGDSPPRVELANAVVTQLDPAISVHSSASAQQRDALAAATFLDDWKKSDIKDPAGTSWLNRQMKDAGYVDKVVRWRCVLQEYGDKIHANLYNAGPTDPKVLIDKGDGDADVITKLVGEATYDRWSAQFSTGHSGNLKLPPRELIVEGKFNYMMFVRATVILSDAKLVPVLVQEGAGAIPSTVSTSKSSLDDVKLHRRETRENVGAGETVAKVQAEEVVATTQPDSAAPQDSATIWEISTGRKLRTLDGHSRMVVAVAYSPDGRQALTGSWDKTAVLWDVATGKKLNTYKGHTDFIRSVAFSPDGSQVLTGSADKTAILWDVATGELVRTFRAHTSSITSVTFSKSGSQIFTGSVDHDASLWDAASSEKLKTFHCGEIVYAVALSPDGLRALTGTDEYTVILWDLATGKKLRTFQSPTRSIKSVAFSSNGKQVLACSDGIAIVWDANSDHKLREFKHERADSAAFSPNGSQVVTGESVVFSPDGSQVLIGSCEHDAIVWDAGSGEKIRQFVTAKRSP